MEGDNKTRRKRASEAERQGKSASEAGVTTGASKQRHHEAGSGDQDERLAAVQRGEQKVAGDDVPQPLRGKGRRKRPGTADHP